LRKYGPHESLEQFNGPKIICNGHCTLHSTFKTQAEE